MAPTAASGCKKKKRGSAALPRVAALTETQVVMCVGEIIQLTPPAPPGPRQVAAVAATAAFIAASRCPKKGEKSERGGGRKGVIGSKEKRAREFFSAAAEVFVGTK